MKDHYTLHLSQHQVKGLASPTPVGIVAGILQVLAFLTRFCVVRYE
jgi:hypothetical protein